MSYLSSAWKSFRNLIEGKSKLVITEKAASTTKEALSEMRAATYGPNIKSSMKLIWSAIENIIEGNHRPLLEELRVYDIHKGTIRQFGQDRQSYSFKFRSHLGPVTIIVANNKYNIYTLTYLGLRGEEVFHSLGNIIAPNDRYSLEEQENALKEVVQYIRTRGLA